MLLAACEGSRSSGLDRAAEVRRGVSRNGDVAGRLRGEDRALRGERTHRGVPADDVDLPRTAAVVGIARSQCGHAPRARDHVEGRGAFLRERRWWQERADERPVEPDLGEHHGRGSERGYGRGERERRCEGADSKNPFHLETSKKVITQPCARHVTPRQRTVTDVSSGVLLTAIRPRRLDGLGGEGYA